MSVSRAHRLFEGNLTTVKLLVHLRQFGRGPGLGLEQRCAVFQLELALLGIAQQLGLALQFPLLHEEIDEHRDLRPQHIGIEWLEDVVDGAH